MQKKGEKEREREVELQSKREHLLKTLKVPPPRDNPQTRAGRSVLARRGLVTPSETEERGRNLVLILIF